MTPPDDQTLLLLRDRAGLTQTQIAERYGVAQSTVSGWYAAAQARAGGPPKRSTRHTKADLEHFESEMIQLMRDLLIGTEAERLSMTAGEKTARARAIASCLDVIGTYRAGADTGTKVSHADLLERVRRATASARKS